jgi:hypothetical protein
MTEQTAEVKKTHMSKEEKVSIFQYELFHFTVPRIREYIEWCLSVLPDYFYKIPASSTGKYHPSYTRKDHPLLVGEFLNKEYEKTVVTDEVKDVISKEERAKINSLIACHMGQWNTSDRPIPMPKPTIAEEVFVHLCDYLASRKMIEFNFEASF